MAVPGLEEAVSVERGRNIQLIDDIDDQGVVQRDIDRRRARYTAA